MHLNSLEFELPLFSLMFLCILLVIYYSKDRLDIIENKYYNKILIFSFIEIFLSTIVHFICALNDFYVLTTKYYGFINFVNKIVTTSFIGIFTYLLWYVMVISYTGVRKRATKINKYPVIFIALFFILTCFTNVKLLHFENVTNVSGWTPMLGYIFLAPLLLGSFGITLFNLKKIDSRYYAILVIIPLMVVGYLITIIVPGMIVYDIIITLFCYIMYFTIENPDMKLLEELHKSKEVSDNANEEKTMFLYNMTQEIRNITGKIDDDANTILDSKDWDVAYDSARDIKANTSKFTNMTNDILDVSNIDASTIKVYNSKYSIKNILKQVISIYGDICKKKELKFITNIDHDIPEMLYGDAISLKEILNTILSNSTEYTNKGYVELSVNAIVKNDICRLIITIEDSGVGIRSEDINQVKVEDKSLAKANKMITLMNGTMLISSDYGVGTKVKLILDQKIETETNSEVSKYENVLDDTSILVVDDSEAGLKIVEKLIKGSKIKLDTAKNGKECIDKLKVNKYDVILLDEELSQITGKELMSKIKEIRNFNTPVILLTKNNSYEYNEEYVNIGFCDYILKPIKKVDLLNKINIYTKKK